MNTAIIQELAARPHDQGLWLALFETLRPPLYYSIYRACRGERELASDITQDAFERFLKYADLKRFETDVQVLAYLRQTARHLLFSTLAKARAAESSDPALVENLPDPWAADHAEALEMEHDIALLAQSLGAEDQALLRALLAGESVDGIAKGLNVSYGAAAVRVHRFRNRIKSKFKELRVKE